MPTKTTKTTKTSSAVRKPSNAYRTGNQSAVRRLTSSSSKRKAVQGDVSESEEIDETTMHDVVLEKAVTTPHLAFPALPEPEELAKYEKIIPGGAERILELAEQDCRHNRELESRQLETSAKLKFLKHLITFLLALGAGALGAALLLAGSELAGLLVIVIDAAALAAVALYGKQF